MKPFIAFAVLLALSLLPALTRADSADELRQKIEAQSAKIAALEKEISAYEATLVELGRNKTSLETELTRLDTSRKKLGADISLTEDRITNANLEIERLGGEIDDKEARISVGRRGVADSLRVLNEHGELTLLEQYTAAGSLEGFWSDTDLLTQLEDRLSSTARTLLAAKAALTVDLDGVTVERAKLAALKTELRGQKAVLDQNRKEQAALLTQTKNTEANYQKLVREKQAARDEFEQELRDFESQLKYTLDPSSIPTVGSGVLGWPIDSAYMQKCRDRYNVFKNLFCITQYFGNTEFARSGAYQGKGHNGIDFGVPTGTRVVAAGSGTVVATGNTDLYSGCYSYGKWVLLRHVDGLSSLYAHLSFVSVGAGDQVPRGSMLGYSGKTGYATGPHLHFTLFATDGVKLVKLGDVKSKTKCAAAEVPVAPTGAYLNPMPYF